ncbi:MAG: type VI secretion system contractile sheath large subunit [Candidatus Competibacteraceae bacterium]|jgi:type VI secretion system protein ImpC|nr:type VI secretion system contractile sheath large subunit [Candidatus Competibacteraceae bacterium]
MPGNMEFGFEFNRPQPATRKSQDEPMRMLILGNFSGWDRQGIHAAATPFAERRPVSVDIDSFDEVLAHFAPRLSVSIENLPGTDDDIELRTLEDFHPDRLYDQLSVLQELRETRERLSNPATFKQAAETLLGTDVSAVQKPLEQSSAASEGDGDMLERLLGKPAATPVSTDTPTGVDEFIKGLIQPHVVPSADPRQPELIAGIDAAISETMRTVLHRPAFQALEATWRGLYTLISELDTDSDLHFYVLDVTQEELFADVRAAAADLTQSALYKQLVERTRVPGGQPWSLLIGDYAFGPSAEDIALLAALGALSAQAGGSFIATAKPALLGCTTSQELPDPAIWQPLDSETAERWQALRTSWIAAWIGLALPRVLARLPYGRRGEPIDAFAFEEIPGGGDHDAFLWGSPAFACASLLASSYLENGWSMQPGDCLELEDLPTYTYQAAGETTMQPCAEVLLGERAAQAILDQGIMPLLSYRNRGAVRLLRFQSLADPVTTLAGSWQ